MPSVPNREQKAAAREGSRAAAFERKGSGYHGDTGKAFRLRHFSGDPAQRAAGKDLRCTGVTVGHCTVDTQTQKTGVTVVMPCADDMFAQKLPAAACVLNGFGKTAGLVQIGESWARWKHPSH